MAQAHYITIADVLDAALKPHVDDPLLGQVDRYIENFAKLRGVSLSHLAKPLPSFALDLAVAYACMTVAMLKSGVNAQQGGNGVEVDIYMVKEKQWRREFERLETMVTAEVLTGDADTPEEHSASVEIFRG